MLAVYNSASICALKEPFRCGLRLQPDLTNIMAYSRNWDELQYTWTEWRRNTGQNIKDTFEQMISLSNEAAKLNSKSWISFCESARFFYDRVIYGCGCIMASFIAGK